MEAAKNKLKKPHVFLVPNKQISFHLLSLSLSLFYTNNSTEKGKLKKQKAAEERTEYHWILIIPSWAEASKHHLLQQSFSFLFNFCFWVFELVKGMASASEKSVKLPEKSSFSQTCSLLSQYLKEKGSLGDLSLGIACNIEANGMIFF